LGGLLVSLIGQKRSIVMRNLRRKNSDPVDLFCDWWVYSVLT
jgi:hypothetical protein